MTSNSSTVGLFGEENPLPPFAHDDPYSRRASEVVRPSRGTQRALVIDAVDVPRTDDEIARHTGLSPNSARPRRKELVEAGLIVRVGTGRSDAGNPCSLWGAATHAKAAQADEPGIPSDLWQAAVDRRPAWMSKAQHQKLIQQALAANGGNVRRALEQVGRDLAALR